MKEKTASWLGSSAILAALYGEPGVGIVRQLLEDAERERATLHLSALTLCDIVSSLIKTHGESVARDELAVVLLMPVQIDSPTRQNCAEAGWVARSLQTFHGRCDYCDSAHGRECRAGAQRPGVRGGKRIAPAAAAV